VRGPANLGRRMLQLALPQETVGAYTTRCDCGQELHLGVQHSAAGYYLGFFCPNCGPYSRESGYYRTREEAEETLRQGDFWR
jgi:hypothetical protein